jgi:hypothetical protein
MLRPLATSALFALAGTASAQVVGVTIEIDQPILAPGDSTTVRLYANFDPADYAIAGVTMSLLVDGVTGVARESWSDAGLLPPFAGPSPTGPVFTERGWEGIIAGQLNFPPAMIYADPTNPIAFWEVEYYADPAAGGGYRVDLLTEVTRFDAYIARDSAMSESRLDVLVEGEASIFIIPAPAGGVLFGLATFAATRRRR